MKTTQIFIFLFLFSLFSINSVFALTSGSDTAQVMSEVMVAIIILGVTITGIIIRNIPTTIIGSMCTMIIGGYYAINGFEVVNNTGIEALSIFMIAFGMFWAVQAALEYIQDL